MRDFPPQLDRVGAPRASLWALPAVRVLATYTFFGFTGFSVTLSALPAWLADRGVAEAVVGLVTTAFLAATVAAQTAVPWLLRRFGMARTLATGLVVLGAPSLLLLIHGGLGWVLAVSAVRGVGFGIVTVVGASLTARIVPPTRHGEAVGIYGLAIAVPNLLAVPGGVALAAAGLFPVVAVLGAAPLLGLVVVGPLARAAGGGGEAGGGGSGAVTDEDAAGGGSADVGSAGAGPARGDSAPSAGRVGTSGGEARAFLRRDRSMARPAALAPAIVLTAVTLASGGFMTYLPVVRPEGPLAAIALLGWGGATAFARWRAGVLADKTGLRVLMPLSSALSILGVGLVIAGLLTVGPASWVFVLVGSVVLGVGFGATQNLSLVAAFARAGQREPAAVSAVWNIGFDSGTALGSALVGIMAVAIAVPGALGVTALLVAATLPLAVRSGRRVRR